MKYLSTNWSYVVRNHSVDTIEGYVEKALCFIEQYGVKVEGILWQSADVDEHRSILYHIF